MRFACSLSQGNDGKWTIVHEGGDVGRVQATASSRDEAVEKMKNEIRYRLELCPCSGESYQHIAVEIVEGTQR